MTTIFAPLIFLPFLMVSLITFGYASRLMRKNNEDPRKIRLFLLLGTLIFICYFVLLWINL